LMSAPDAFATAKQSSAKSPWTANAAIESSPVRKHLRHQRQYTAVVLPEPVSPKTNTDVVKSVRDSLKWLPICIPATCPLFEGAPSKYQALSLEYYRDKSCADSYAPTPCSG
jgi:hypothetical protein